MIVTAARPRRLPSLRTAHAICSRCVTSHPLPRWSFNVVERSCTVTRRHYSKESSIDAPASFPATGDTIYALSSGAGRAGIAVIRISGPSCLNVYNSLCPGKKPPKPRYAAVRTLYRPGDATKDSGSEVLDSEALILYFPSPRTVTGEDVLELHVHGGPATVKAVLAAIAQVPSTTRIRYAEPGEFTKRAFINDRLDLAQIESLSDTLAAETEQQRRAAVVGNSGALGRTYESWRQKLLLARGEIEALIDFSEDQHFDESQSELLENVTAQVDDILYGILLHESGSQRSELLRSGIRIALLGTPNAGKSSLMNLIVGREASIVSGEAGTTRDIVEASLDVRGYLCSFADTAGFRTRASQEDTQPISAIEEEGIRRARQKASESDMIVVLASIEGSESGPTIQYDPDTLELAAKARDCLVVVNKRDAVDADTCAALLGDFETKLQQHLPNFPKEGILSISCLDAQSTVRNQVDAGGLQTLVDALATKFSTMTEMPAGMQDILGVTERQRQLLVKCQAHLVDFMNEAQPADDGSDADSVLAAEYLRYAANCLARITGKGEAGDVEEVLGVVFEKFCVGK